MTRIDTMLFTTKQLNLICHEIKIYNRIPLALAKFTPKLSSETKDYYILFETLTASTTLHMMKWRGGVRCSVSRCVIPTTGQRVIFDWDMIRYRA